MGVMRMYRNRIREQREKLGISQSRLACMIGIAGSTLSNLELGKWKPYPKARRDIAEALGVTEEELFPEGDKRSPESQKGGSND
jgi:transcriptional regulator with XRE-family HTH domain